MILVNYQKHLVKDAQRKRDFTHVMIEDRRATDQKQQRKNWGKAKQQQRKEKKNATASKSAKCHKLGERV